MKKLAIYSFYNEKGEVNDYVFYALKALQEIASELAFVANCEISQSSKQKLSMLNITTFERENIGYDFSAWKFCLEQFGFDNIAKYDELILTNDSYYGPIYPFSQMWDKMDKVNCDIWGISKHTITNNRNIIENLQSNFIVFRQNALKSDLFKAYWRYIPKCSSLDERANKLANTFTRHFEKMGFAISSFVNSEKYSKLTNANPAYHLPDRLLIEDKSPIVKRKIFYDKHHKFSVQGLTNKAQSALEFIKHKTNYDEMIIWQDLLKSYSMHEIALNLNLNYTLSTSFSSNDITSKKTAFILYIYYLENFDKYFEYISNMPKYVDIFIVSPNNEVLTSMKDFIQEKNISSKIEYRKHTNQGREQSALLITCKDIATSYEYICFIHGKKTPHVSKQNGEEFAKHCTDNLIYNEHYINNVIDLLENNPQLGFLIPPVILFNPFATINSEWLENFEIAENFVKNILKLDLALDDTPLAPYGGMFWFRREAFNTIFKHNWKFEDFPAEPRKEIDGTIAHAIERLFSYFVQDAGYATAWILSDKYSQSYLKDMYNLYRTSLKENVDVLSKVAQSIEIARSNDPSLPSELILGILAKKLNLV